jgi:hypothetical protein
MQYVEKKFMEVDYNMLVQKSCSLHLIVQKYHLMGGGAMAKDLTPQCGGE